MNKTEAIKTAMEHGCFVGNWKPIRRQNKNGETYLLCVEGEPDSVSLGRFDDRWIRPDGSPLYPEEITPTHYMSLPAVIDRIPKSAEVISLNEWRETRVPPHKVLNAALDIPMDDVVVVGMNNGEAYVASSMPSVAEFIFYLEIAKTIILKGTLSDE